MLGLNDKVPVLQQQWEQGDQLTKTEPCSHVLIDAEVEGNRCWERAQGLVIHLHARDKGHSPNVDYG